MPWSKDQLRSDCEVARQVRLHLLDAAERRGIDRLGVADPTEVPAAGLLHDWLARGDHAGMEYLARHQLLRLNPERFFPGVASILCAAVGYGPVADLTAPTADAARAPRVAAYARKPEYHQVLKDKLHGLLADLKAMVPDVRGRVAVDTAPVLERHWAARAGLGWIGKNTCLIVPGLGSWVFLGEIFLDVPLPADHPIAGRCGSCDRCLQACPGGALPVPYRLDARRCLSYWTVEHRGPFSAATPRIRPWLFGCDVCQLGCPWNRKVAGPRDAAWGAEAMALPTTREGWCRLSAADFERDLAASALERAGYAGLRRNLARWDAEGNVNPLPSSRVDNGLAK